MHIGQIERVIEIEPIPEPIEVPEPLRAGALRGPGTRCSPGPPPPSGTGRPTPGPAVAVVQEGTFTYYDGEDRSCTPHEYGPGEAFVDLGQGHVHSARNEGTEVVHVYVTYFDVPPTVTSSFVPADDPGFCDF